MSNAYSVFVRTAHFLTKTVIFSTFSQPIRTGGGSAALTRYAPRRDQPRSRQLPPPLLLLTIMMMLLLLTLLRRLVTLLLSLMLMMMTNITSAARASCFPKLPRACGEHRFDEAPNRSAPGEDRERASMVTARRVLVRGISGW
jgi:hypothetical protein